MPPSPLVIIGLGGSQSPTSSSLYGLRVALQAAQDLGAHTELISLDELELPLYHPKTLELPYEELPLVARDMAELVATSHGMIWSSPLYHGSVSAAFKNAIDWLELLHHASPPYLAKKAIGLMASSGGNHAMQAINSMEYMVRALRGHTVPYVVPLHRSRSLFDQQGQPLEDSLAQRLSLLGQEVFHLAQALNP